MELINVKRLKCVKHTDKLETFQNKMLIYFNICQNLSLDQKVSGMIKSMTSVAVENIKKSINFF